MPLTRLALTDFRSYADALVAPGSGFVVLTGENGAGKTNVLEAVSLLAPGRGLRGAALGEMARSGGGGGFSVAARLSSPLPLASNPAQQGRDGPRRSLNHAGGMVYPAETDYWVGGGPDWLGAIRDMPTPSPSREREGGEIDIGTGTTRAAPERRQVRINSAPAASTALSEWLSIVWLTPAMDRLFSEAPSGRRRFLDRLVLALVPGHAVHAARYEAAMRARNKLLAEEGPPDVDWLTALEARMAEHGAAIAEARGEVVAALGERLADAPEGPFARAGLALDGWHGSDLAGELSQGRARDAAASRALVGPHRTDLAVAHLGKGQPAERCSTGEQKALLLGLVLAHADLVAERAGRRPILLLDEVAAHLDPLRRAALFDRLGEDGGQVWLTGTEPALFDAVPASAQRLTVAGGALREG